jgi:biopolymer transport protein TolR
MRKHKKHLDFEINLIPCIDLLSVCICFLLLTAVWLNIGSMNVKQAIGGQTTAETEKKPLLYVTFDQNGGLNVKVQESAHVPKNLSQFSVAGMTDGNLNVAEISKAIQNIKTLEPQLKTVLIQPMAQTSYQDIIQLMDEFKKMNLSDLGVVPL